MLYWVLIIITCIEANKCIPETVIDNFKTRAECEEVRTQLMIIKDRQGYIPTIICTPTKDKGNIS